MDMNGGIDMESVVVEDPLAIDEQEEAVVVTEEPEPKLLEDSESKLVEEPENGVAPKVVEAPVVVEEPIVVVEEPIVVEQLNTNHELGVAQKTENEELIDVVGLPAEEPIVSNEAGTSRAVDDEEITIVFEKAKPLTMDQVRAEIKRNMAHTVAQVNHLQARVNMLEQKCFLYEIAFATVPNKEEIMKNIGILLPANPFWRITETLANAAPVVNGNAMVQAASGGSNAQVEPKEDDSGAEIVDITELDERVEEEEIEEEQIEEEQEEEEDGESGEPTAKKAKGDE
uniref:Glutamic acid-rich protein-like n=1 Tax=Caenorhabditis tropicalis TaxID=1561998 RepID=A0A1I7T0C0_9PELO